MKFYNIKNENLKINKNYNVGRLSDIDNPG